MTVLRVIRDCPLPERKAHGVCKAALADLRVGDAMDWAGSRHSIVSAAKRMGWKVRCEARALGVVRVWRVG